jgi:hypothetical protein
MGDVLVAAVDIGRTPERTRLEDSFTLWCLLQRKRPGDALVLIVKRRGSETTVTIKLGKHPEDE